MRVNDGVGLESGNYERFMESLQKSRALLFNGAFALPYLKSSRDPL
jgi:hypothetical protein